MKSLKAREFAPVYVLMGDEPFYIDKICDYIAEAVLQPEERDFNQTVLFGADTTAVQIVDQCKGYPMMAEYRVVIVKEAQNLKSLEALERYLEKPVKSTVLVICHKNGTIDRRKKFLPRAEKAGVVFESKKLYDRQLPGFIETYLKARKATIEPKAVQMIADHIGARQAAHLAERFRPQGYPRRGGEGNRREQRLQCLRASQCHHPARRFQGKSDNKVF